MTDGAERLSRRTARGMLWAYGSYVGGRVLVLLVTAILARLLTPSEFGLVGLALVFTAFLDMLRTLGISEALIIVDDDEVEVRASTAFLAMTGFGLFLSLVCAALGPAAAAFFDEPKLTAMLPVLGLTFFLRSLGATHYALAQKRMDFRARTAGELADVVVRGLTGVGLAVAGAGAWSIVGGYLAGTLAMSITLWIVVRWRPVLKMRGDHLRQLLGFGGALTGVTIAGAILGNVDGILIGRVLGTEELGLYSLAGRLPDLVIVQLSMVAGQVLFPAFASVDESGLRHAFLTSMHYTSMIALPIAALLVGVAGPIVFVAFGDQWHEAVPVMQVFTLYAITSPITLVTGTVLKSRGKAGLLLKVAFLQVALVLPAVWLVVDQGIMAVAIVHAAVGAVILSVQLVVVVRIIRVSPAAIVRTLAVPLVAALAVGAISFGADRAIDNAVAAIAVAVIAGGAAALAVLWALDRPALQRLLGSVVPRLAPAS